MAKRIVSRNEVARFGAVMVNDFRTGVRRALQEHAAESRNVHIASNGKVKSVAASALLAANRGKLPPRAKKN